MKRLLVAAVLTMLTAGMLASAEDAPLISPAQLEKILKFIDTAPASAKHELPSPTALSLGFSTDPTLALPVVMVVTNDHKVYFCRSELDPKDYIIWVRTADKDASYMFSTHADFKLIRAVHLRTNKFPDVIDGNSTQVQTIYKNALKALAKDIDSPPPH
jgi:hypothetical protein